MEVLQVVGAVAPSYGGPTTSIVQSIRHLDDEGVRCTLLSTDADGDDRLDVPHGEVVDYQGVPAVFHPVQFPRRYEYSRPLAAWVEENVDRFDIVHIHGVYSHASHAAADAARAEDIPYIVKGIGHLDRWSWSHHPIRKRIIWWLRGRTMCRGASAIHYTSTRERTSAEGRFDLPPDVVIPPATTTNEPEDSQSSRSSPYVLFLGRLHEVKGLHSFLPWFLEETKGADLDGWRLRIAGRGPADYERRLRRLAADQPERVDFIGWVDDAEKARLLADAELVVLPSLNENFGIASLESLAVGTPALVSENVGFARRIREYEAGWVSPLEEGTMRDTLREALADADERRRRGQRGKELVDSHHRWPTVARRLRDLYEDLSSEPRRVSGDNSLEEPTP